MDLPSLVLAAEQAAVGLQIVDWGVMLVDASGVSVAVLGGTADEDGAATGFPIFSSSLEAT